MKARQMIIDALPRSEDDKRLLAAFDIAWKKIAPRAGDPAAVSENLARWLVSVGNGHPNLFVSGTRKTRDADVRCAERSRVVIAAPQRANR